MKTEIRERIFDQRPPFRPDIDVARPIFLGRADNPTCLRESRDTAEYRRHSSTAYAYDDAQTRTIISLLRPALELQCGAPPPG